MDWELRNAKKGLKGEITAPPDKSVSHRSVMFGSIAGGESRVKDFLFSEDCMRTYEAFRAMGIRIEREKNYILIKGKGLKGLDRPKKQLYLGNSGTTMRVISGILAAQPFDTELTGDESLSKRPMERVMKPLRMMGSDISSIDGSGCAPLLIKGRCGPLKAISYKMPVASAQVKSCVLSAGLYAKGRTTVSEPFQSRDHTERMLKYFSADISKKGLTVAIKGGVELAPKDVVVPGDISSAAFFMIAALIVKGSRITIRNVGLNPTRTGIISVLERMGADIRIKNRKNTVEPYGDLEIRSSRLKGACIKEKEVPLLIDEIPVLIIAAITAEGTTEIKGIGELKVKETDRVRTMKENLSPAGVSIAEKGDSLVIGGGKRVLSHGVFDSFGDHRIAMSMGIASLISDGGSLIKNVDCVDTSYPGFLRDLKRLSS